MEKLNCKGKLVTKQEKKKEIEVMSKQMKPNTQVNKKKGASGITLIALIITIVILIILATITVNFLFGENGLITMAQKAKDIYENAQKEEEQQLAGVFGKKFADYNGQLYIDGTKLKNQYNEEIQLKGLVSTAVTSYSIHYNESPGFSYYLNDESIKVFKDWGVNVIRVGLEVKDIENTDLMQDYLNTVDLLIENDMYVIIILWNNHQINDNIEIAKQYFSEIAEKYKDTPNIIYEIANEPDSDISWSDVREYSNTIIPIIRSYSENNIIIIPNPGAHIQPEEILLDELVDKENIMTSYHLYVGTSLTKERIDYIKNTLQLNIPIFVTEWGTTLSNGNDGFYEDYSNAFVKIMENYNLSWCNYHIGDLNFKVNTEYSGIVKHNQWNNSLSDNILTASGKYIKSILQGNCNSYNNGEYAIMMSRNDSVAFWQDSYKDKIVSIQFRQESSLPNDVLESWDISLLGNESVKAYIKQADNDYELYIISNNIINLPIECYRLFADFSMVKGIDFSNISTECINSTGSMFSNCPKLETIDGINNFSTNNLKFAYGMFAKCSQLQKLDLSNWNTSNLENMLNMFSECLNLAEIVGIENWDTSNVKNLDAAFAQTRALTNLDISNWNVDNVTSMNETFNGSYVQDLNISNWNMSNCTKITGVFKNTIALENLYLNNVELNVDIITNYEQLFSGTKQNINIYVKNSEIAQFIYERLNENSITGNVYYGTDGNWLQYTG